MTIPDEGYIKFSCHWSEEPAPAWDGAESLADFIACRERLVQRGWLGQYEQGPLAGIGFGNLSVRAGSSGCLWISGSATGGAAGFGAAHVALVTGFHVEHNSVQCVGPVKASSETMTHAVVYDQVPGAGAILHIHEPRLWRAALNEQDVPRSGAEVPYGTPEMAHELGRLLGQTRFAADGLMAMAGHEEGILAFGQNLAEAEERLVRLAERWGD